MSDSFFYGDTMTLSSQLGIEFILKGVSVSYLFFSSLSIFLINRYEQQQKYFVFKILTIIFSFYIVYMKKKHEIYLCANLILQQNSGQGPLVLGDHSSPLNPNILKKYHIRTILSFGKEAAPQNKSIPSNILTKVYNVRDQKSQQIANIFAEVYELIEKSRQKGGVLMHCYFGVSRSASFVISYLINKNKLTYQEAYQFVKSKRSCISPNESFVKQLKDLEAKKQQLFLKKSEQCQKKQITLEKKQYSQIDYK